MLVALFHVSPDRMTCPASAEWDRSGKGTWGVWVLLQFSFYFLSFFVFLPFLGPRPLHMEIPRLGVESEP